MIFLILAVQNEIQVLSKILALYVMEMARYFQDRPRFGGGLVLSFLLGNAQ
jgi:hypothetical protein